MLELRNVSCQVDTGDNKKEILKNINLTLPDDKFIVVTGPNGGGKSTLARVISGIQPISGGQILMDGEDITNLSITDRAKKGISFAFQQPVRFKGIKVLDLIRLGAGENMSTAGACAYLSKVGLCARDYINRDVDGSLSGGELKRIEIAISLARSAPLSIFDEPEAGIDLWSFNNLIDVFKNLRAEKNGSIIVISHQERILSIADVIVVIGDGKVKKQGPGIMLLPEILQNSSVGKFGCPKGREVR